MMRAQFPDCGFRELKCSSGVVFTNQPFFLVSSIALTNIRSVRIDGRAIIRAGCIRIDVRVVCATFMDVRAMRTARAIDTN